MRIPTIPVREGPEKTLEEATRAASEPSRGPDSTLHSTPSGASGASASGASTSAPSRAAFLRSFVHAWDGVVYAVRTQRNARVHLAAAVCALALGVLLHLSPVEFALIFLAVMAVLVAELFNTVVEAIVDLVTSEYHPLARVAKDVAAGAVLVCAMFAVVIGLLVFGPHLWALALHLVRG